MENKNGFYEVAAAPGEHLHVSKHVGNGCPPHFHESIEMVFAYSDGFRVTVNGEEYTLDRGDIAFINGFDVHYYPVQNILTFVIVMGRSYLSRFSQFAKGKVFPTILKSNPRASEELMQLIDSFCGVWKRDANELIKYGFADTFLGVLCKYYPLTEAKSRPNTHIITEILGDIQENLAQPITLDGFAEKYGYSKTYLSSLFNEYTGSHFRDYVNRLRIERAAYYLSEKDKTKDTVPDIAARCGFDSLNTFYRALKKFGAKI